MRTLNYFQICNTTMLTNHYTIHYVVYYIISTYLSYNCKFDTFFFVFCLFRAAPVAHGGSQARGLIGAIATSLHYSHSNTRSKPHLRPAPQLMAMPDP